MTMATALDVLGAWGRPPDLAAWTAGGLGIALALLAIAPRAVHVALGFDGRSATQPGQHLDGRSATQPGQHLDEPTDATQRRRLVLLAAFAAAFLSLGYMAEYLRGGPRIIDATSYFLEGRALSHGKLAWSVGEPTASFRGRFLLFREPSSLGVIFPPGYPLLLALGFLVGAPMVVGPVLAAAIVVATYWLTRELVAETPSTAGGDPHAVAVLAVLLSVGCAALRYHTADTMAHGASALGIAVAFTCALRARRTDSRALFALAGLATGWVCATRPVSAIAIGAVVLVLAMDARDARARASGIASALLAMLPGVFLLAWSQHAIVGSAFASAQRAYYATSDGPPGCFRYGFGAGVGCLHEHGDFVRARMADGYGFVAALGTTLRRLRMHTLDVANFEPLALLVFVPLRRGLGTRAAIAVALVLGQILAYAPFYFDGNYPGGGARFYADVLPVEHALIAVAVAGLLPRIAFLRRAIALLAVACAGFAVHAAHDHLALANRDAGRPEYEPDVAREAQVSRGLVFFETDGGFNLAHDPTAIPTKDIVAARLYNDDHDRLLYDLLGRPAAHVYRTAKEGSSLTIWVPSAGTSEDTWRFEAEAEWPPLAQDRAWAEPAWASGTCASGERALVVTPDASEPGHDPGEGSVTLELPVAREGRWLITPRVVRHGGKGRGTMRLVPIRATPDTLDVAERRQTLEDDAKLVWEWDDMPDGADRAPVASGGACGELHAREASLEASLADAVAAPVSCADKPDREKCRLVGARLVIIATGGSVTLDRTIAKWLRKGTR